MRYPFWFLIHLLIAVTAINAASQFEKVNWVNGGEIVDYYQSSDGSRLIAVGGLGGVYEYDKLRNSWMHAVIRNVEGEIKCVVPLSGDTVIVLADEITLHSGGTVRSYDVPPDVLDIAVHKGIIYILTNNNSLCSIDIATGDTQVLGATPQPTSSTGRILGVGGDNVYMLGWDGIYIYSATSTQWEKKTIEPIFMGANNVEVTKIFSYKDGIIAAAGDAVVLYSNGSAKCDTLYLADEYTLYSYSVAGETLYVVKKFLGNSGLFAINIGSLEVREIDYASSGALDVALVGSIPNVIIILEGGQFAHASMDGGNTWVAADVGIEEVFITQLANSADKVTVISYGVTLTGSRYSLFCRQYTGKETPECVKILGQDTLVIVDRGGFMLYNICGNAFYGEWYPSAKAVITRNGEIYKLVNGVLTGKSNLYADIEILWRDSVTNIGESVDSAGVLFVDNFGVIHRYMQSQGARYVSRIPGPGSIADYMVGVDGDIYYCDEDSIAVYRSHEGRWRSFRIPDSGRVVKIVAGMQGERYMYTTRNNLYLIRGEVISAVDLPRPGEVADIISSDHYLYLAYRQLGLYAMEYDLSGMDDYQTSPDNRIFPLPANTVVHVPAPDERIFDVVLYRMQTGLIALALSCTSINGYLTINLQELATGTYLLVARQDIKADDAIVRKIAVKH